MKFEPRPYGDNSPLNFLISYDGVGPFDLTTVTPKITIKKADGTVVVSAATTGLTAHPTQSFTLDSTNNWITCNNHGFKVGDVWVPSTSGSLSGTGLTAATRYKIVEVDVDWFRVAVRSGGMYVTIAGAGTGTHSGYVVGSLQYLPQSTYEVGQYEGWIELVGSTTAILPAYSFDHEVVAKGN